ncbi:MAG: hypothetical protein KF832_28030 [Caldilineaceae bacterium]|nr:hypothetical protein [Caldilineaceae bacterium]
MAIDDKLPLIIRLRCRGLADCDFGGRNQVRLGVQKGKVVVDDLLIDAAVDEIIFHCALRVEQNTATGKPNFLGPYAHGTPTERFLYLCWGERKGGLWEGFGRTKIHLKERSWSTVAQAVAAGNPLEATILLCDPKGRPRFASINHEQITWRFP